MNLKSLLIFEESRENRSYHDSKKKLTGGIGHLLSKEEQKRYPLGTFIPDSIIDLWFKEDTIEALDCAFVYPWYGKLNEARKAVVCSMIFQLGANGFNDFKQTIKYLSAGRYEEAAKEMLDSKWFRIDTPARAKRHSDQMRTGEWCKEYLKEFKQV